MNLTDKDNILTASEYELIFKIIADNYMKYCQDINKTCSRCFNLKTNYICHICDENGQITPGFDEYISKFIEKLSNLQFAILLDLDKKINITKRVKFSGRVKTDISLKNKVYKKFKKENGCFPINKCLNDLLGFRIIDSNYKKNIEPAIKILEKIKQDGYKVKHMERINKGYKAYHIYFKMDNSSFPIELQLWDEENEDQNISLHKEYKQDYKKTIIEDY